MTTVFDGCQAILSKLRDDRDRNLNLHPTPPKQPARTLLLLGPSRAGKSTIAKVLADSLYQPPKRELYAVTRQPEPQQIGGLRIIDMPGFCDLQTQKRNLLKNTTILDMLGEQIRRNDPIHLFAFVFSLSDGINQWDINTMLLVQSKMPHLSEKMMLVVTHAEEMDEDMKDRLIKDFFNHPEVRKNDLRSFFKQGVFFVGSLRYESLQQNNYEALVIEHQSVLEMRKKLIDKCFKVDHSHNKRELRNRNQRSPLSLILWLVVMVCVSSAIIIYLTGLFPLPHHPIIDLIEFEDMQKVENEQLKVENEQLKEKNEQLKLENEQLKEENEQLKEKNEQQRRAIEIQNKQVTDFAASFLNNTINTECETKDTHVHKKEER